MTDRTKTICPPIFDLRGIKIANTFITLLATEEIIQKPD